MDTKTESLINSGNIFYPEAISKIALQSDALFYFIFWISVILLLGLTLVTGYFIWVHLKGKAKTDEPHLTHSVALDVVWTVIPVILVLIVFYWGYKDYIRMRIAEPSAIKIQVQGWKWNWGFEYADGVTSLSELVVPVNTPIQLIMSSKDVIHSFYLPNLRIKRDVIPNRYTTLAFKAEKLGTYQVFCTEYCGDAHSQMLATMRVVSEEDYKTWLANGGADREMPLTELGETLYTKSGCNACHSLDGTDGVGPTWKGLYGKEREFTDGTKAIADENYLRESIVYPQKKVVKGYPNVMPSYAGLLKDREITALIEYIKTLK